MSEVVSFIIVLLKLLKVFVLGITDINIIMKSGETGKSQRFTAQTPNGQMMVDVVSRDYIHNPNFRASMDSPVVVTRENNMESTITRVQNTAACSSSTTSSRGNSNSL